MTDFFDMLAQVQRPARKAAPSPAESKEASPLPTPASVKETAAAGEVKGAASLPPLKLVFPKGEEPAAEVKEARTAEALPTPSAAASTGTDASGTEGKPRRMPNVRGSRSRDGAYTRPSKAASLTRRDHLILTYMAEARIATAWHIHVALGYHYPPYFEPVLDHQGRPDKREMNSLGALKKRISLLVKHGWLAYHHETPYGIAGAVKSTHKGIGMTPYAGILAPPTARAGTRSESLMHQLLIAAEIAKIRGGWFLDLGISPDAEIVSGELIKSAVAQAREQDGLWYPKYDPDATSYDPEDLAVDRGDFEYGIPDFAVTIPGYGALSYEVECSAKGKPYLRKVLMGYAKQARPVIYLVGNTSPFQPPNQTVLRRLYDVLAEIQGTTNYPTEHIDIREAEMSQGTPDWDEWYKTVEAADRAGGVG